MNQYRNSNHPSAERIAEAAALRYQQLAAFNSQKLMLRLKQGVWAYFILLLFEGALRRWILPGLATPLLVVREPVALWLIIVCLQRKILIPAYSLTLMTIIGVLGLVAALTLGHGNPFVALYGTRILLIHFPMMFIIRSIFTRKDVVQMGKVTVMIAIPMLVLIAFQFYSPQTAWVNRGVGGEESGAGFSGAMGFFRPPGTFSFTNGTTLFFSFAASFIFYFWLNAENLNRWILIAATGALMMSIPLSISRALLFQIIISVVFCLYAGSSNPRYIGKMFGALIGLVLLVALLSQTSVVGPAIEAFTARFENANESEGGLEGVLLDRYLGGMVGALSSSSNMPLWGYGVGMGTNVGAMLLTGGLTFLIAEGEWGRSIGELGPILGLGLVFIRIGLAGSLGVESFRKLRSGDLLPWMLLSNGLMLVAQGGWGQPTSLGFATLAGGLLMASLRDDEEEEEVPGEHT